MYLIILFQTDHTTGDRNGYYISLSRDTVQQPGDRGMFVYNFFSWNHFHENFRDIDIPKKYHFFFQIIYLFTNFQLFVCNNYFSGMLMSRDLPGSTQSQCISFWYYMYEPIVDNTGPNLGKLAVWVRTFDR